MTLTHPWYNRNRGGFRHCVHFESLNLWIHLNLDHKMQWKFWGTLKMLNFHQMCIFHSRDMVPISHHSSQWEFQFPIYTSSEIELFEKKCGKLETCNIVEDKHILGEGRPLIIAGKLYENPVYVNSEECRFISLFRQNGLHVRWFHLFLCRLFCLLCLFFFW